NFGDRVAERQQSCKSLTGTVRLVALGNRLRQYRSTCRCGVQSDPERRSCPSRGLGNFLRSRHRRGGVPTGCLSERCGKLLRQRHCATRGRKSLSPYSFTSASISRRGTRILTEPKTPQVVSVECRDRKIVCWSASPCDHIRGTGGARPAAAIRTVSTQ